MLLLTKGVYRSMPTKSMEILLNYPPLHMLLKEEASKAFVRVHGKIKLKWDGIGHGLSSAIISFTIVYWASTMSNVYSFWTSHGLNLYK